jgi:hypothetical protein
MEERERVVLGSNSPVYKVSEGEETEKESERRFLGTSPDYNVSEGEETEKESEHQRGKGKGKKVVGGKEMKSEKGKGKEKSVYEAMDESGDGYAGAGEDVNKIPLGTSWKIRGAARAKAKLAAVAEEDESYGKEFVAVEEEGEDVTMVDDY